MMRPRTTLGRKLHGDRRFSIVFSAGCTLVLNLLYGFAHAVFGVLDASAWLLTMAAYHILLGVMRFGAVLTEMGRPFGVSTGCNPEFLRFWRSIGATILFAGNDVGYVYEGAQAARKLLADVQ